jgi:DNA-directed RNA polymerase alpha subunit
MAALGDSVFQNLEQVDEKTLKFTMSPVVVTYANTLRRAVQTEVEVLGFRADMLEDGSTADVKILKNTTPMSNEMLADRVGLLPIQMPAGSGCTAWAWQRR